MVNYRWGWHDSLPGDDEYEMPSGCQHYSPVGEMLCVQNSITQGMWELPKEDTQIFSAS